MDKFAKASEVEVGTRLIADAGFQCLDEGKEYIVSEDDCGLYINCRETIGVTQKHYINGQLMDDEYIGLILKKTKQFKFYYETRGGHVHMSLFGGNRDTTLGKCGDLIMREDEFEEFRKIKGLEFLDRDS